MKSYKTKRFKVAQPFELFIFSTFNLDFRLLQSYKLFPDRTSDCNEKVGNYNDIFNTPFPFGALKRVGINPFPFGHSPLKGGVFKKFVAIVAVIVAIRCTQ
ncbi:MAG: hypothetical protein K6F85_01045 [Bacteroidales bacterium]|nr:hypothetical protein [Bacteroidales bacterium]